jgi:hypothetical protein
MPHWLETVFGILQRPAERYLAVMVDIRQGHRRKSVPTTQTTLDSDEYLKGGKLKRVIISQSGACM